MITKLKRREDADYDKRWREKNRERSREIQRKFRKDNPEAAATISKRYRKSRRSLVNALKSNPCSDCGKCFPPVCMDYDHVRGEKKGSIYQMYTRKLETLMEEIAKCDLVCANCHRLRTSNRKSS